MRIFAVDIDFLKEVSLKPLAISKCLYVGVGSGFLLAELVAGESQDAQAVFFTRVIGIKLIECFVFGVGNASFGRHVHYHTRVTFIFLQADLFAVV